MEGGKLVELGLDVKACALGQASAALMSAQAIGLTAAELETARDKLTAYLAGEGDDLNFWPGLTVLAPARGYSARHASIRLSFEAVAEAARAAEA